MGTRMINIDSRAVDGPELMRVSARPSPARSGPLEARSVHSSNRQTSAIFFLSVQYSAWAVANVEMQLCPPPPYFNHCAWVIGALMPNKRLYYYWWKMIQPVFVCNFQQRTCCRSAADHAHCLHLVVWKILIIYGLDDFVRFSEFIENWRILCLNIWTPFREPVRPVITYILFVRG